MHAPFTNFEIKDVTTDNVSELGIYCIKDKKSPGYQKKIDWFKLKINEGLKMKIAYNQQGKQIGFIEYTNAEKAWRPIKAPNHYFIQCIALFVKEAKNRGIGSALIQACEADAKANLKEGLVALSSDGPWMANKELYLKNQFQILQSLDRFELLQKKLMPTQSPALLIDFTLEQKNYKGWHLIFANQCPWHQKSVTDLQAKAKTYGINLQIKELLTPEEAQKAPSGFGTFSLIKDGKLLADHYISSTRFENILNNENKLKS